jgi:hypothetical protein
VATETPENPLVARKQKQARDARMAFEAAQAAGASAPIQHPVLPAKRREATVVQPNRVSIPVVEIDGAGHSRNANPVAQVSQPERLKFTELTWV